MSYVLYQRGCACLAESDDHGKSIYKVCKLKFRQFILDEALLACPEGRDCKVQRGSFVELLSLQGNLWCAHLLGGDSARGHSVFIANGKHDLRGCGRAHTGQGDMVAFKMHLRLASPRIDESREFIELLNQRLQGAVALWDWPLALSSIPYGHLAGKPFGLWCVGDQAAVIPSFTGDGMSITLHSSALAMEMYLAGERANQYNHRLHAQMRRGLVLATCLSRFMVTKAGRGLALTGLSLFPNAIRWVAALTRIPAQVHVARLLSSTNRGSFTI